ncbi:MAG TPA: ABC transporter substrate-binding protein [Kribbella sp.]|nr:ABC transporter substrate-binding protein [Kribbella sp.]
MSYLRNLPRSRLRVAAILVAGLLAVTACSPGAKDQQTSASGLRTVNLINTKYAAELLPVTAGLSRGIFKAHGIDLKVTKAKSSDVATSALVSGRQDLALLQQAYVVSASASGAPLVMVGNVLDQLDYHIITSKDVTSLDQLAGKKFGGPGPNNGNTAVMRYVMDKAGIGQDKLQYVTVGVQAGILAAIQAGQVQVGLLVAPFDLQARKAGLHDLGTVQKYLPGASAAVIAGVQKTMAKKPDLVRDFLAALVESTRWVAANPDAAVKLLAESEKMPAADAKASYDEVAAIYAKDGTMDSAALQTWIDVAVKYGVMKKPVKPADIYTAEYLKPSS